MSRSLFELLGLNAEDIRRGAEIDAKTWPKNPSLLRRLLAVLALIFEAALILWFIAAHGN